MKYIASVSFGKDSLAMLLIILNNPEKYPLDEVIFYDTGMEFKAIYKTRDKILPILKDKGIKYTELHPQKSFIDLMINYPHLSRNGVFKKGYGWCGGVCRWGTTEKVRTIDKYCGDNHQYIGLAYDEVKRLEKLTANKSSPLAKEKITEEDALQLCYENGFYYEENGIPLYDILTRVSCWCCRNKNLKELANYKKYLTNYFLKLCELEEIIGEPMKKPYFLKDRFKEEITE